MNIQHHNPAPSYQQLMKAAAVKCAPLLAPHHLTQNAQLRGLHDMTQLAAPKNSCTAGLLYTLLQDMGLASCLIWQASW